MAVADEIERLVAVQLLVAREEIDDGIAGRPADVVEVAPVDVEPDPAEGVHQLVEAAEVDGDQIVHRQPRQLADGFQRALGPALGVGAVDPRAEGRTAGTDDVDVEVPGQREHRDRLGLRVGADEHDRVGAGLGAPRLALAAVVADDERRRRLAGQRDVEALRRDLHVRRVRDDRRHALVEPEVRASRDRARADEQRHQEPDESGAEDGPARARQRRRLAVDRDRRQRAGRQDRPAVSVHGRTAAHASLQRRSHVSVRARRGRREAPRIPEG